MPDFVRSLCFARLHKNALTQGTHRRIDQEDTALKIVPYFVPTLCIEGLLSAYQLA